MDCPHWDDPDWNWGFEERKPEQDESRANEWYDRMREMRAIEEEDGKC